MTITDYLINAVFVLVVLRQARERRLDARSLIVPLVVVFVVARNYVHAIPSAGNDLVLVALLSGVGVSLGILGGLATHLRVGADGAVLARVGWTAGALLVGGICARMAFVFAAENGAGPPIRNFSIAHHIGAAAWPVALVAMALLEVAIRLIMVAIRARRLSRGPVASPLVAGASA